MFTKIICMYKQHNNLKIFSVKFYNKKLKQHGTKIQKFHRSRDCTSKKQLKIHFCVKL